MLFVLRSDFPVPAGASIGERNIITALKTYGAYVVDQGSSMGLDADTTHPELWTQAGMYGDSSMPIHASDWRPVNVGTAPTPEPAPEPAPTTEPAPSAKPGGGSTGGAAKTRRARVQIKTRKGWKTIGTAEIRADGTFKLHLPHRKGHRKVRVRVVMPGGGRTKTMRVRL
jgi:hypothetical protein